MLKTVFSRLKGICNAVPEECVDVVQPPTMMLIVSDAITLAELQGLQERRDSVVGSFNLRHYCNDRGFFANAITTSLSAIDDKPIIALFTDDKNGKSAMKPIGKVSEVCRDSLVAECVLFSEFTDAAPRYIC